MRNLASGIQFVVTETFNRPLDPELIYTYSLRGLNPEFPIFANIPDDADGGFAFDLGNPPFPSCIIGLQYSSSSANGVVMGGTFDSTNNNLLSMTNQGDIAILIGVPVSQGALQWRAIMLDGAGIGGG